MDWPPPCYGSPLVQRSVAPALPESPPHSSELVRRLVLRLKDVLDGQLKDRCDFEGQRQAGIVPACLDGADRLTGDLKLLGQLLLRPTVGRA